MINLKGDRTNRVLRWAASYNSVVEHFPITSRHSVYILSSYTRPEQITQLSTNNEAHSSLFQTKALHRYTVKVKMSKRLDVVSMCVCVCG